MSSQVAFVRQLRYTGTIAHTLVKDGKHPDIDLRPVFRAQLNAFMCHLALYLLGTPRLERDGDSVHVKRRKVMALLAYLAVTSQPHSRETLTTLLSPEFDTARARNELRRTLSVLSRLLGADCLIVDRETVGLNPAAELWLDVDQFRHLLATCDTHDHPSDTACPDCVPLLEEAVALYQDDFLAGFTLPDSLQFEEWGFFQAETLRNELANALQRLVRWYRERAEPELAIDHARRWLALDPLHEPAHRQLMELYAQAGRRSAALRQYRACLGVLEEELGIPPATETTALYEHIRAEREAMPIVPATARPSSPVIPAFLERKAEPAELERRVFVARERELAQLNRFLDAALTGQGGVAFVTGGPGRGKTSLIEAFARCAMDAHSDLLVATGNCNAYFGVGDPYLPFRQVIQMLTGDIESSWATGAICREHAQRLWTALPQTVQALLDHGTALIDILLPGGALLSRAAAAVLSPDGTQTVDGTAWLEHLKQTLDREKTDPGQLAQSQLFEGYARVLGALAARHPLLLILDDLQWADNASLSLLFHLGRGLRSSRILVVGAYRPEEVALGRDGGRHPLEKVLAEFKRDFGDVRLDLSEADESEGRRFVDAFLDTEPNRLGDDFRGVLFQNTGGHPLFTVELLREMQERGDLVRDEGGRWIEGPALDWETLPARVEAVIEERVGRLDERLRDILTLASVEGEAFTAQVVSRLGHIPERQLLRALSQELSTHHRLVREGGEVQVAGTGRFLARYQFTHALFQAYLYHALGAGERRLLHGEVAEVLEDLYAGRIEEITVQLAHHYAAAGQMEKAVDYLLRAGDQARMAYAHGEAISHYRRALALQKDVGEYDRAARTLMRLGLTHHTAFQFQPARQAFNEAFELHKRAAALPPPAATQPAPHPLRLPLGDLLTLDPALAADGNSALLIEHLFSGLVELGPQLEIVPDLAHSWEMSEGGRKFVFHLRDDVRWSDGTALTAPDVAYAWKRVLDPATGSPSASMLHDIKGARAFHHGEAPEPDQLGVHALDALTLDVQLEEPVGYFLYLLTHCATYPVPRHAVEKYGPAWAELSHIVTSGPFKLESWHRGKSMHLVRNRSYYAQFSGNLQHVELILLPEDLLRAGLELYEADRLDITYLPDPPEGELARRRHAGEYISMPLVSTGYVGFDVSRSPFDDPRVRRAFVLAVDREYLADVVLGGYVFPATGGFVPPGIPGHTPGIDLPYDPERAQQLLAEAGYPGGRGFPGLDVLTFEPQAATEPRAVQFTAQWRDNLGIEIGWKCVEMGVWLERMSREPPHIHFGRWMADYPDPDSFLRASPFRHRTRWQNDVYDRLVEQARHAMVPGERVKLYQQAEAILVEEVPLMPVFYDRRHTLVKPWVSRFPTSAIRYRGYWKDVIIEPH